MTNITVNFQKECPKVRTFQVSQYFAIDNALYILCRTGDCGLGLINLFSGNRRAESVTVGDTNNVTEEEIRKMVGNFATWKAIDNVQIIAS